MLFRSANISDAPYYFFVPLDGTSPLFGGSVDAIIEQGTSGSWTYRKWNSGIYECWLRTANGSSVTINFPITFVELPRIVATSGSTTPSSNYGAVTVFTRGTTTAKTDISFGANVANTDIWADVYVIGRWK